MLQKLNKEFTPSKQLAAHLNKWNMKTLKNKKGKNIQPKKTRDQKIKLRHPIVRMLASELNI